MDQELKRTDVSLILKGNGYEKVAGDKKHVIKFVQSMIGSVVFLWEDKKSKNQMISEFFSQRVKGGSSDGLFSIEPVQIRDIENTLYENFYSTHKSDFLDKAVQQVSTKVSKNSGSSSTKYAFEDDTWLIKRGLKKQLLDTETVVGRKVDRRLSFLCMYHRPDLDMETIEKLVRVHGYVIVDQPLGLYRWNGQ